MTEVETTIDQEEEIEEEIEDEQNIELIEYNLEQIYLNKKKTNCFLYIFLHII